MLTVVDEKTLLQKQVFFARFFIKKIPKMIGVKM
jgi:hypothetical protein